MSEGFVDSSGIHRYPGENYVDAAGITRSPGENYIDAAGITRSPGENYIDAAGIVRSPGETFIDADGIPRTPDVVESCSYEPGSIGAGGSGSSVQGGGYSLLAVPMLIGVLVAITVGLSPVWHFMAKNAINKAKSRGQQPGDFALLVHRITRIPTILILVFYAVAFTCAIIGLVFGIINMAGILPQLDWSSISFS